jgi:putative ABC transport system permease protein
MHFFHILSTLRRHKTAAALIIIEIALTCAIVSNAVFLIGDRLGRMDRPSGIAEDEVIDVDLAGIGTRTDEVAVTAQDLAALRALPGVKAAAATDMVPFGNSSWNTDLSTKKDDPDGISAGQYMGQGLVETFGVTVTAGRDFQPGEYVDIDAAQKRQVHVPAIILTSALARRLFHDENPIGKPVYATGSDPQIVVGVIDRLTRPNEGEGKDPDARDYAMILPIILPFSAGGRYILRVDPARQTEVIAAIDATLNKVDPTRIIEEKRRFSEIRATYFKQDRAMAYLLVGVSIALLLITALGVVGLASFWVQQRTRQIGIRRALGATRGSILRYFQLENFILATIGIAFGMVLAYGINVWLMSKYNVARLPAEVLPVGALLLWTLGQIAVLGPAMRAATISPAIATRTV